MDLQEGGRYRRRRPRWLRESLPPHDSQGLQSYHHNANHEGETQAPEVIVDGDVDIDPLLESSRNMPIGIRDRKASTRQPGTRLNLVSL
jgi:hypothetical protein